MRFLPLVWGSLLRRKVRTTFTVGSIFIAFLLYAFLMTIRTAFSMGVDVAGADRLIMMHKVSLLQPLPVSYEAVIQATPGVKVAAHTTLFGGMYQNRANQFAVIAVDPEPYLEVFSEYHIPSPQVKAWLADRQGALVGRDLATRYGWKLGDRAPLQATIYPPKDGTAWFFNIDAIYDGDKAVDKAEFYFHYDYLNENRRSDYGQVGW